MEQTEIIEGNKLIADFMGFKPFEDDRYGWLYSNPIKGEHGSVFGDSGLKFHLSWEWLMLVVDKIELIGEDDFDSKENYHFFIKKRGVRVIYDWDTYSTSLSETVADMKRHDESFQEYRYELLGGKLESTWHAVIEFIKWYNNKAK